MFGDTLKLLPPSLFWARMRSLNLVHKSANSLGLRLIFDFGHTALPYHYLTLALANERCVAPGLSAAHKFSRSPPPFAQKSGGRVSFSLIRRIAQIDRCLLKTINRNVPWTPDYYCAAR